MTREKNRDQNQVSLSEEQINSLFQSVTKDKEDSFLVTELVDKLEENGVNKKDPRLKNLQSFLEQDYGKKWKKPISPGF